MDSEEDLLHWLQNLPGKLWPTAWAMINMIMIESLDQEPMTDFTEAKKVIDRVKGL